LLDTSGRTRIVHDWVRHTGFEFFGEEGFRSKTLTCVKNNKEINVLELAKKLREKHHLVIDPGYGKIRGKTFRLPTWAMRPKKLWPICSAAWMMFCKRWLSHPRIAHKTTPPSQTFLLVVGDQGNKYP